MKGYTFVILLFDKVPSWFANDNTMKYFERFFRINAIDIKEDKEMTQQLTSTFNITYREFSGHPGKNMIEHWISTIDNNPNNALDSTVNILYMEVKKMESYSIESASYWRGALPTNVAEQKDNDCNGVISWIGMKDVSFDVEAYAMKVLKEKILDTDDGKIVNTYLFKKEIFE